MLILFVTIGVSAQETYQILGVKNDTVEWQDAFGIIKLDGSVGYITFDDYSGKIVVDPTTYLQGKTDDKHSYIIWDGFLSDGKGSVKIKFSITYLEKNLLMTVHFNNETCFYFITTKEL